MAAEDSSSSALTAGRDGQLQRHFVAKWRQNGYTRLPSGHNFCREVRRVSQVTRNDEHTRTAFHANLIAMDNGLLDIEDVAADDHVLCTQCARGESAVPTPCSSATCPTNTSGLHKHLPDETPVAGPESVLELGPDLPSGEAYPAASNAAVRHPTPILSY